MKFKRARLAAISFAASSFFCFGIGQTQASLLSISQKPLVLSDSVAPNLILSLDNSGSMRWAFVPDDARTLDTTRRVKSAAFNPMYYDPNITYRTPVKYDSNGKISQSTYSTTFTKAWNNGFLPDTTRGSLDLSTDYKVTWAYPTENPLPTQYGQSNDNPRLAVNPQSDFFLSPNSLNTTYQDSRTGIKYSVTGNSDDCKANVPGFPNASCSFNWWTRRYEIDLTRKGVPAYYYRYKSNVASCRTNNDDCYDLVFVSATSGVVRADDKASGTNEKQNFANWYSFYRNRALATISAANLSFTDLPQSIRVTWQTISGCNSPVRDGALCGSNFIGTFTDARKGDFFSWLPSIRFGGGTPLFEATSRAGELLKKDAAWRENPAGTTEEARGAIYSCRPSFHVLMTDGVWSGDGKGHTLPGESNSFGNYDNKSHTRGDNSEYSPAAPFADGVPNTLADLALYYWANDLMPGLANNVKPVINVASANPFLNPRNNPATWQHMVNYTVSFGLSASLNRNNVPWTGETYAGAGYEALLSGKATWWPLDNLGKEQINDQGKVYDLWHAAVNSRGEFFNADSPDKVVDAFAQIINRIGNYATSSTRPAVAASQTTDSSQREIYETEFSSGDWSGDVKRYNLNSAGARSLVWSAKSKLVAARTVKMARTDGTVGLKNFTWDNLNAAQRDYLNVNPFSTSQASDLLGEPRTEYIRGVRTREGTGSTDFRQRSTVLGDIVNSTPVLVKAAQYVPYLADRIDGSAGTYASFQRTVSTRTPVVYVGANDGMLHGFNAETGDETFAFIPTAVFPNLSRLTGQNYKSGGHRFYVDGTPVVSDVYYDNAWHTVLIGSLRGGGRSLFALDVTDPGDVKLLWEFSHEDLGYTFATPTVARLNNGKWAVLTGNGYGNQNGSTPDKAAMFVLDVKTGAQLTPDQKPLVVTGDTTKANGLSSVRLADNNSDGIADYAYAGDLQGNLWRFDLFDASTTASDTPFSNTGVSISYNAKPLFKAVDANGNAQAITAPPSLVRHPTQRGYLVIIGTGKYFEDKDAAVDTTRAQSIYAIWDRKTKGEATGGTNPPSITRSSLIEQTITSTTASESSNPVRLLSKNVPVWYKDGTTTAQQDNDSSVRHWGWRMDLQVSTSKLGEMMISPMTARGDALIFTTLTPNDDPCKDGVTGWLYGLNPTSGARTSFNVFDFNGDGIVDSEDSVDGEVGSGYQLDYAGGHTLNGDVVFSTGENIRANFGPTSNGRQTWQLIPCDDEDNECEPSE